MLSLFKARFGFNALGDGGVPQFESAMFIPSRSEPYERASDCYTPELPASSRPCSAL